MPRRSLKLKPDRTCDRCGIWGHSKAGYRLSDLDWRMQNSTKIHIYSFRNSTRISVFLCSWCVRDILDGREHGTLPKPPNTDRSARLGNYSSGSGKAGGG